MIIRLHNAKTVHQRLLPKRYGFTHTLRFWEIRWNAVEWQQDLWPTLPYPFSLERQDHLGADVDSLETKLNRVLASLGTDPHTRGVRLFVLPKFLGFGFNPVRLWILEDQQAQPSKILFEVSNTYGQRHPYILDLQEQNGSFGAQASTPKVFSASPFNPQDGSYTISCQIQANTLELSFQLEQNAQRVFGASLHLQHTKWNRLYECLRYFATYLAPEPLIVLHATWIRALNKAKFFGASTKLHSATWIQGAPIFVQRQWAKYQKSKMIHSRSSQ